MSTVFRAIVTDHNKLTYLKGLKDTGGRLSQWMLFLQQFDLQIVYKPGKQDINADTFSRIPVNVRAVQVQESLASYLPIINLLI